MNKRQIKKYYDKLGGFEEFGDFGWFRYVFGKQGIIYFKELLYIKNNSDEKFN